MCDTDCNNLIDLSLDDYVPSPSAQNKTEYQTQPSKSITTEPFIIMSPTSSDRVSLDNNPFDSVQRLVERPNDPFDIVEKEVFLKAQQSLKRNLEVKVANLLSLSDDNLLDDKSISTPFMNVKALAKVKAHELDLESPPVVINAKLPPASDSDSNPNSSAETTASAKLKTSMEYRKRLLKYSISNAAFNSPVTRKNSLEFEDVGTPVSLVPEFEEQFLSTESPLKLVDDDILAEESISLVDSEKIFEADLEMMKIPILNDLPSPAVESLNINSNRNSPELLANSTPSLETTLPNLEAIRAKIKAKREEVNNNHQQEIVSLINNLKSLITKGEMVDESKKQHASTLLESLSTAFKPSSPEDNPKTPHHEPQPVKRQGTFNLELEEDEKIKLENRPLVPDMPASMTSSTATYDGEERQDLNLPEIAPISPQDDPLQNNDYHHNINENSQNHLQSDVSDILEQLSKLLMNNNSGDNGQNTNNPTFIVVMNTNPVNQNSNPLDDKETSAFVNSYMENMRNDGSPDLTKEDPMRRRSQSLSIHDKVKIVQLPLTLTRTLCSIQKQNCVGIGDSPPLTTTSPTSGKETTEIKTPARMIRRNSYSSHTPYTPKVVGGRFTGFGSHDKNSTTQLRKPQKLDSHYEGDQEQQSVSRPLSMPSNNLPTFKPDLKKKTKNTESIMTSSGPLRATIPLKKVAPMLRTSPPTPEKSNKKSSSFHNTSSYSQPSKTNRVPTTPLSAKEGGIRVGYPNACSTPAVTTPVKRTGGGAINKPRYSYTPATPSSKTTTNSTSLKKRTEFKAKSPLRARASSMGLAAAATASTSTLITSVNTRLSTSAGTKVSKTPVKLSVYNTASAKSFGSRYSTGGSGLAAKNKENKKP